MFRTSIVFFAFTFNVGSIFADENFNPVSIKVESIPVEMSSESARFGNGVLTREGAKLLVYTNAHVIHHETSGKSDVNYNLTIIDNKTVWKVPAKLLSVSVMWDMAILVPSMDDSLNQTLLERASSLDSGQSQGTVDAANVFGFKMQTIREVDAKAELYHLRIDKNDYATNLVPRVPSFLLLKGHLERGHSGSGIYDSFGKLLGIVVSQKLSQLPAKIPIALSRQDETQSNDRAEMIHLGMSINYMRQFYEAIVKKSTDANVRLSLAKQILGKTSLEVDGLSITEGSNCGRLNIGGDHMGIGGDHMGIGGDSLGIGGDSLGIGGAAEDTLESNENATTHCTLDVNLDKNAKESQQWPFVKNPSWLNKTIKDVKTSLNRRCIITIESMIFPDGVKTDRFSGIMSLIARIERENLRPIISSKGCDFSESLSESQLRAHEIGKSLVLTSASAIERSERIRRELPSQPDRDDVVLLLSELNTIGKSLLSDKIENTAAFLAPRIRSVLDEQTRNRFARAWDIALEKISDSEMSNSILSLRELSRKTLELVEEHSVTP